MVELIIIAIIFIISILLFLLASLIENVFFTLRIKYLNHIQQENITNFLNKYHIKFVIDRNLREIHTDKGLLFIIFHIIKYIKLSRFFSDIQTIENAYFQIKYETNNIKITNKISNKNIININNKDDIWELAVDNISDFFDEEQLINMIKDFGYITDKQSEILISEKTVKNYIKGYKTPNNYLRNNRKIFDVNNCSIEQLAALPGITLIIAKKLVKYRNDNNGFKTVADFWSHSGLNIRQRIIIEREVVIKAKKLKTKYIQKLTNIIQKTIERIVDI